MASANMETSWLAFLAAWERGDDAGCLTALRVWQAAWEECSWANDFSNFGVVYHEDVELHEHLGFIGTVDVYRGLEGFRGWRRETMDVASALSWEPEQFQRLGTRFALIGTADARWRYTKLPVKVAVGGVWTLRDGRIEKVELYRGRARILRALERDGE